MNTFSINPYNNSRVQVLTQSYVAMSIYSHNTVTTDQKITKYLLKGLRPRAGLCSAPWCSTMKTAGSRTSPITEMPKLHPDKIVYS